MFAEPFLALMGPSMPVPVATYGGTPDTGADFAEVLEAAHQTGAKEGGVKVPLVACRLPMPSAVPIVELPVVVESAQITQKPQPMPDDLLPADAAPEVLTTAPELPDLPLPDSDAAAAPLILAAMSPPLPLPVLPPPAPAETAMAEPLTGSMAPADFPITRGAVQASVATREDVQAQVGQEQESVPKGLGSAALPPTVEPSAKAPLPIAPETTQRAEAPSALQRPMKEQSASAEATPAEFADSARAPLSGQTADTGPKPAGPPHPAAPPAARHSDGVLQKAAAFGQPTATSDVQDTGPQPNLIAAPQPRPNQSPVAAPTATVPLAAVQADPASRISQPVAAPMGAAPPLAAPNPNFAAAHRVAAVPFAPQTPVPSPVPNPPKPAPPEPLIGGALHITASSPLAEPLPATAPPADPPPDPSAHMPAPVVVAPDQPNAPPADLAPATQAVQPHSGPQVQPKPKDLDPIRDVPPGEPAPTPTENPSPALASAPTHRPALTEHQPAPDSRTSVAPEIAKVPTAEKQPVAPAEAGFLLRVADSGTPDAPAPTRQPPLGADVLPVSQPDAPPDPSATMVAPAAPTAALAPVHAPPEPIRHPPLPQQIAAALAPAATDQPGTIDLVLRPDELGSLRFEMRPQGDRLHVVISAERPETLDLLRRSAPELMAELRQSGLQGSTLQFGQWSQQRSTPPPPQQPEFTPLADLPLPPHPAPQRPAATGLDLRL